MVAEDQTSYKLNLDDVRTWLEILFADAEGLIHISSSGDWTGRCFKTAEEALPYVAAADAAGREGIYARMTTLWGFPQEGGRGSEAESHYLPALWSDLDIAGPNHKTTKTLPPDEAAARKIIEESGLPEPTLWISTGGGLHPYWLLKMPMEITDRERVKQVSVGWQKIIAHTAKRLGYFVDGTAVADLARIMRIPGTINRKNGAEQPCTYADGGSGRNFIFQNLEAQVMQLLPLVLEAEEAARPKPVSVPQSGGVSGGLTPGDDFAAKTTWEQLLVPAGWRYEKSWGGREYWTRPGKERGVSASTGGDADVLWVFSSSTEFESWQSYTKFGAYATIAHDGDFQAAARQLRKDGFGEATDYSGQDAQRIREIMGPDAPPPVNGEEVPTPPAPRRNYTWDDVGNAQRMRDHFGGHYRFVKVYKEWMTWDGTVWIRDDSSKVHYAAQVCTELMMEQAKELEELAGDDKEKLDHVKSFRAHIKSSRSATHIKGAVTCLAYQPGMSVKDDDFDRDGHLVTVHNGIINLDTGELMKHDAKHMLTRVLNARYDAAAKAPRWEKFLEQVLPDPALRAYVQRAMGYTLLGDADRRAMFLLYGPSGTGKSQFIEALAKIFGDFATTAAASTFRKKHGNTTATNDIHGLKGRRLISSSETSETSEMDEELVKRITGRDQITSRDVYEKYQTWTPEGAVWLTTNFLPKLSSDDNAVWLRVKAIEFGQIFVNTEQDCPNIGHDIADAEGSGILNWLLEGVRLYRELGLEEPEKVKQSNADHRRESDNVAQFLEESLDIGLVTKEAGREVKVATLFERYEHWCQRNRISPLGIRRFNQRCVSLGLIKHKGGAGYYMWEGLRINEAYGLMGTMT